MHTGTPTEPADWVQRTLRWLFRPPVFPDDPVRTRQASLFYLALWFCIFLGTFGTLGNLVGGRSPSVASAVNMTAVAVSPLLMYWARRGWVAFACGVLISNTYLVATSAILVIGTIRLPALGVYSLVVMMAAYMFGKRAMLTLLGVTSASVATIIWAEKSGHLPIPDYTVTATQWITFTVLSACFGGLAVLSVTHLRKALEHAEREVAERKRAELELRAANAELQKALASVRTLSGLLPVCAWCRKVRDDDGYWSALESYVASHTDATISHGICPDCRKAHFPWTDAKEPTSGT